MAGELKDKLDQMIAEYQGEILKLQGLKGSGSAEDIDAVVSGACCNACIKVSSICVPDKTTNKCEGGCTATSFAF